MYDSISIQHVLTTPTPTPTNYFIYMYTQKQIFILKNLKKYKFLKILWEERKKYKVVKWSRPEMDQITVASAHCVFSGVTPKTLSQLCTRGELCQNMVHRGISAAKPLTYECFTGTQEPWYLAKEGIPAILEWRLPCCWYRTYSLQGSLGVSIDLSYRA